MTLLHDLQFSPPPNSKSRLCLCIKACAICIPDTGRCILDTGRCRCMLAHLHERLLTKLQMCKATKYSIRCLASSLKFFWYGSMEWNMEENFTMEWNMEWKIFGMEWKKIASMEYGKTVSHSIPCPGYCAL